MTTSPNIHSIHPANSTTSNFSSASTNFYHKIIQFSPTHFIETLFIIFIDVINSFKKHLTKVQLQCKAELNVSIFRILPAAAKFPFEVVINSGSGRGGGWEKVGFHSFQKNSIIQGIYSFIYLCMGYIYIIYLRMGGTCTSIHSSANNFICDKSFATHLSQWTWTCL